MLARKERGIVCCARRAARELAGRGGARGGPMTLWEQDPCGSSLHPLHLGREPQPRGRLSAH
eukprot:4358539-Pyramimonas_sp.AAC.1